MKKVFVFFLLFALCSNFSLVKSQGRLDGVKDNIESGSSGSGSSNSLDYSGLLADPYILESMIELTGYALYYGAYKLPFGAFEKRNFYDYPYANGNHGEYSDSFIDLKNKKSQFSFSNTLSLSADNIIANKTSAQFRFTKTLGVDINYLQFYEERPFDDLNMSSAMLNFYRIREKNVTGYWGVGASHVGGELQVTGIAYNLGLDIYWGKPISTELYWKQSYANKTPLNEFKFMLVGDSLPVS